MYRSTRRANAASLRSSRYALRRLWSSMAWARLYCITGAAQAELDIEMARSSGMSRSLPAARVLQVMIRGRPLHRQAGHGYPGLVHRQPTIARAEDHVELSVPVYVGARWLAEVGFQIVAEHFHRLT